MALPDYPIEHEMKGKSPVDLSKIHTAGVGTSPQVTEAYGGMGQGIEDLAASLEQRFEPTNWYKIAAAFAKPQLGGFGASFGSAMEELGKQEEARRAVAPTVARMRAEIGAQQVPLNQNFEQQRAFRKFQANPTPELGMEVLNWSTDTPAAKAVLEYFPTLQTIAGTRSTNVNTAITGQKAAAEMPYLVLNDPIFKGTVAEPKPEQVASYIEKLDAAKPKDIQPEQWAGMGVAEKQDAVARYAAQTTSAGLDEEGKSAMAARSADNLLNDLTYLRTLSVDPKLAPMFSLFKNGDAISMFRSFLDKNPGNTQAAVEGLTAAAMDQLKNADEQTRAKADKFIKGLARLEVNLRGSNVNPTDAFQQLNSMQSPNLGNSQAGFVGILDQMGLQAKHDIDRHDLRVESKVPARRMLTSPEARQLENQYRDEAAALAKSNALKATPSWYKPPASPAATKTSATQATAPQPTTGSTDGMRARLAAEIAAREAARAQQRP